MDRIHRNEWGKPKTIFKVCKSEEEVNQTLEEWSKSLVKGEYRKDILIRKGLVIYLFRDYKQLKKDEVGCWECGSLYHANEVRIVKTQQGYPYLIDYKCPKCNRELGFGYEYHR